MTKQQTTWSFRRFRAVLPLLVSAVTMGTGQAEIPREITRFAFGSCGSQEKDQSHWEAIAATRPQAWIWLGDNIYADHFTAEERSLAYEEVKGDPGYRALLEQAWITGIWDDHDYGNDSAGISYPFKVESKAVLYDFLDVPKGDPSRKREGIYRDYLIGPPGRRLHLVLLDTRSFKRTKLRHLPGKRQILGDAQWAWLEETFRGSKGDLVVLASGIHVISPVVQLNLLEGWAQVKPERRRLLELIRAHDRPVLILSGDRHSADFSRVPKKFRGAQETYEFMSSGLTHGRVALPNRFRVNGPAFSGRNFGLVEIDWGRETIDLKMTIRDALNGEAVRSLEASYRRMGR